MKFAGTIDGEPFDGGSADRMPLVIGEDRMIPGWEDNLVGMKIGESKGFDITFPDDYRVEELQGKQAHFEVELLDLREKLLPEITDEFVKSVGDVETLDELRTEIREAMETRAEAEARHAFGDRIIDFATTNATVELPEVMVTNEIEIMRDELRNAARPAADRDGPVPGAGQADARGAPDRASRAGDPSGEDVARPVGDRREGGSRRQRRGHRGRDRGTAGALRRRPRSCGST